MCIEIESHQPLFKKKHITLKSYVVALNFFNQTPGVLLKWLDKNRHKKHCFYIPYAQHPSVSYYYYDNKAKCDC